MSWDVKAKTLAGGISRMPRRVFDETQGKLAPTAADLGEEAYQANLRDHGPASHGETAGTVPTWQHPEAENAPPGQSREDAQEVKIGQDFKQNRWVSRGGQTGRKAGE